MILIYQVQLLILDRYAHHLLIRRHLARRLPSHKFGDLSRVQFFLLPNLKQLYAYDGSLG
jgi:hypothetical protein